MAGSRITIIRSINPEVVCKRYRLDASGGLQKSVVAHVSEGEAKGYEAPTAERMVEALRFVSSRADRVIVAGAWKNDDGERFRVVDERKLQKITGQEQPPGGVILHDGQRISARLKRGIEPSAWVLLDADNPPGIPPEWAAMSIGERLALWEPMLPGISKVERIEMRGSSARVLNGSGSKPKTHAWIRVNKPSNIPLMKAWVGVEMVNRGLSFRFAKRSRVNPEKVVGIEARSVFDLAVFDTGRLVFCAQPDVQAEGYSVDDPGIEIVNQGGGELDIAWLTKPSQEALSTYREKTGVGLDLHLSEGGDLSIVAHGILMPDTEITSRGVTKSLLAWADGMKPGDKLRCESPFRESYSEAGFIRIGDDGVPFVYDVGNGTTYRVPPLSWKTPAKPEVLPPVPSDPKDDGKKPAAPADAKLRGDYVTDSKGNLHPNLYNAALFMNRRPELAGALAFDEFSNRRVLLRAIPGMPGPHPATEPVPLTDAHVSALLAFVQRHAMPKLTKAAMWDAIELVCAETTVHPVRSWLESLRWDGLSRIDDWLCEYLGAVGYDDGHQEYLRAVGRAWLISAVARVFRPGSKADAALILEGPQGIGKSSAAAILAGRWFGDALPHLGTKDASTYLQGLWIVELAELANMARAEVEVTTACLSRTEDRYRPAYGRLEVVVPRQCVFIGTTNADGYLRDQTGNRRFWPVRCGTIQRDKLEEDREQIWAEAVAMFRNGEPWWLDAEAAGVASQQQEQRVDTDDPWAGEVMRYAEMRSSVCCAEIVAAMLPEKRDRNKLASIRVAGILRASGWEQRGYVISREFGKQRAFVKADTPRAEAAQ